MGILKRLWEFIFGPSKTEVDSLVSVEDNAVTETSTVIVKERKPVKITPKAPSVAKKSTPKTKAPKKSK